MKSYQNALHYFGPPEQLKHIASLYVKSLKREEKAAKEALSAYQTLQELTRGSGAASSVTLEEYMMQQYREHQKDHTLFLLPHVLSVWGAFTGSGYQTAEIMSRRYKTLAMLTRIDQSYALETFCFELASEGVLLLSGQCVLNEEIPCPDLTPLQRLGVEMAEIEKLQSMWFSSKPLQIADQLEASCGCMIFPPPEELLEQEYLCKTQAMTGRYYVKK